MKKNGNLMYHLLKIYSVTLMIIITLFAVAVSLFISRNNREQAERLNRNSMLRVSSFAEDNQKKAMQLANKIEENEREYQGLSFYFALDFPDYWSYTVEKDYKMSNMPSMVQEMYNDDHVESVSIDFMRSNDLYLSTKTNKYGEKVTQLPKTTGVEFTIPLQDSVTWNTIGILNLVVDQTSLTEMLEQLSKEYQSEVFLISDRNQLVYTNSQNADLVNDIKTKLKKGNTIQVSQLEEEYFVLLANSNKYQVVSLVNRRTVKETSQSFMIGMLTISIIIEVILLLLLYRLFNGYVFQVEDILSSVNKVSSGDRSSRLNLIDKKAELKDISIGINDMLESLDDFIRENYELELRQKDADFRALQAQINPHFMYNTLEYIRMYALSEGLVELSEVVFSFASILRNNISDKKMITVEREMKFVEQYVYLYQMRYPKNIAYAFKIDQAIKEVEIPKFCLQPLVENYFAHGVDFTRSNNLISVYSTLANEVLEIKIRDNGVGMSQARLTEINQYLATGKTYPEQSIGIQNVNERMKIIFGNKYRMTYKETIGGGTTISITIRQGDEL